MSKKIEFFQKNDSTILEEVMLIQQHCMKKIVKKQWLFVPGNQK